MRFEIASDFVYKILCKIILLTVKFEGTPNFVVDVCKKFLQNNLSKVRFESAKNFATVFSKIFSLVVRFESASYSQLIFENLFATLNS